MKNKSLLLIILLVVLFFILNAGLFIVDETQMAIITQFGKPVLPAKKEPGLHFKIPFIQKVHFFEKRIMEWDGYPNQIPTKDKKYIWVDTTARWRIVDPLKFMQSVKDEMGAQSRLDDIIDAATRDNITRNLLIELVRDTNRKLQYGEDIATGAEEELKGKIRIGRSKITEQIKEVAAKMMPEYGIELVDVKIKRINYVDAVRKKVFNRMISERERIAEKYRSEGEGEKARILGEMKKEEKRIYSEAYKQSEEIKGAADAKAAKIYADAFGKSPEFYSFLQTLNTYEETINDKTYLILTTDSDFLKYIQKFK